MKESRVVAFKGRFLGIAVVVVVQFIIGIIHVISGFALVFSDFSFSALSVTPFIYSVYTLAYGSFTFLFAYLLWTEKRLGWIGTIAVSLFVIVADFLAVFDVFNVLGIPKAAAIGEIPYSLMIVVYLIQSHVRSKYSI